LTRPRTPEQLFNAANSRIDKLGAEVATLQKVLAAQNQATASLRREWSLFAEELTRAGSHRGVDASKSLATLST